MEWIELIGGDKIVVATLIVLFMVFTTVMVWDSISEYQKRKKVENAASAVFIDRPERIAREIGELAPSETGPEGQTEQLTELIEDSRKAISMGRLHNLYRNQIDLYQQQTRSRATWSFIFAIVAMSVGLGFVFWGGTVMLGGSETTQLAAGASISAIGGAVSAYIAKTFLDVHRLSISQLNRYFRQPVINDHILMAQRLAEDIGDDVSRKQAYEHVIKSISNLISASEDRDERV